MSTAASQSPGFASATKTGRPKDASTRSRLSRVCELKRSRSKPSQTQLSSRSFTPAYPLITCPVIPQEPRSHFLRNEPISPEARSQQGASALGVQRVPLQDICSPSLQRGDHAPRDAIPHQSPAMKLHTASEVTPREGTRPATRSCGTNAHLFYGPWLVLGCFHNSKFRALSARAARRALQTGGRCRQNVLERERIRLASPHQNGLFRQETVRSCVLQHGN